MSHRGSAVISPQLSGGATFAQRGEAGGMTAPGRTPTVFASACPSTAGLGRKDGVTWETINFSWTCEILCDCVFFFGGGGFTIEYPLKNLLGPVTTYGKWTRPFFHWRSEFLSRHSCIKAGGPRAPFTIPRLYRHAKNKLSCLVE